MYTGMFEFVCVCVGGGGGGASYGFFNPFSSCALLNFIYILGFACGRISNCLKVQEGKCYIRKGMHELENIE